MTDMYMTPEGDIARGPDGDIANTSYSVWRDDVQAAYIRTMTDIGDFELYPNFGANLSQLYGMPQTAETGDIGIQLITSALSRENRFLGKTINVTAVPISYQCIRFDISITISAQNQIKLSITQNLVAN